MTKVMQTYYNKSAYFLLPMLGVPLDYYNNLINCYLGDLDNDMENYLLYVLLELPDDKIRGIDGFIREYEVSDGIMYIFKINDIFKDDYLKFTEGKYSQFSEHYKDKIFRLLPKPYRTSNVYKVVTKSKEARKIIEDRIGQSIGDQEVMSIPSLTDELYG